MPLAPYATLRAALNAGPPASGGITAALTSVVQLSADPAGLSGAQQVRFEIYGYPPGYSTPSGWAIGSDGVMRYSGTTPPTFTLSLWGKYLLRLVLNNGTSDVASIPSGQLTYEATALSVESPNGLKDLSPLEGTQFSGHGWAADLQATLRAIDDGIGSGGGSGSTSTEAVKEPVYAVATSNITLSGIQSIDGVSVSAGKRVLVAGQSGGVTNGIYVAASGAWTRASDWAAAATIKSGCTIQVVAGGHAGATMVVSTADPIVVGTTSVSFTSRQFVDLTGADGVALTVASGSASLTKITNSHVTDNTISPGKLASGGSGNNGKVLGVSGGVVTLVDSVTVSTGGTVTTTTTAPTTIKTVAVANSTSFTFEGGAAMKNNVSGVEQKMKLIVSGTVDGAGVVTLGKPKIDHLDRYTLGVVTFATGTNQLLLKVTAASAASTSTTPYGELKTVN
jgi:hypothetical protein